MSTDLVGTCIAGWPDELAEIAIELRSLIKKTLPDCIESIKWGYPVYELDGLVCSIRNASRHIALQFFSSGIHLDDPNGLLQGSGQKMRHIKIRKKSEIQKKLYSEWLVQAAKHNCP